MTNGRDCDQSHEKEALQWAIEYFKGHADYGSLRPGGRQKEELDNMLRLARQGLLFDSDEQVRDYIELATAGDNGGPTRKNSTAGRRKEIRAIKSDDGRPQFRYLFQRCITLRRIGRQ
jgi:hypothetical protein